MAWHFYMTGNEWIELATGYDREVVKERGRAALAEFGRDADKLGPEEIRLDAGTDTKGRRVYRVSVASIVISPTDRLS